MFTGIVEEMGTLVRAHQRDLGYEMVVRARRVLEGTRLGDSIAVDGACLTVAERTDDTFTVRLAPETLSRTTLGRFTAGARLNLERSLTPSSRMGGHFVQGHVDGVGTVLERRPDRDALWLTIGVDPDLMRWVVPKGFVALDGVSLTVVDAFEDRFSVTIVSYTQAHVTLPGRAVGDGVNVENDILGKYVERMLAARTGDDAAPITKESLDNLGYA